MDNGEKVYDILVVEDNLGDFFLVELFLNEQINNLKLTHATNFKKAKEIIAAKKEEFDVVLLDLSLPDKTGLKLVSEMVSMCRNAPVLVLTGYADMAFGIKSLSLGISDYILKDELTATSLHKSIIYNLERKKNVNALLESEKQYSELFHLSPQPMWVFDSKALQFLDVNNAAIKHYGYSREEFLAMTREQIRELDGMLTIAKMKTHPSTNSVHLKGIFIQKKKNGEFIKVDIHANAIELKGREVHIILVNDVSERLDYINAIELQNKKLKEISWIQSHVVRSPLARILGLISLLENTHGNDEERDQIISYLTQSANELDQVIKDITKKISLPSFNLMNVKNELEKSVL